MSARLLRAVALGIASSLHTLPALAASDLQVIVQFEEPTQAPKVVRLAPGDPAQLDISMGYTITQLDFSSAVRSARLRSHTMLLWRQGTKPGRDLTGIERALTTTWRPMPCRQSSCEFRTLGARAHIYDPDGKVRLGPVLARLRAIAADPTAMPERRAAARAAIRACGTQPAARGCVALENEDEIDVIPAASARRHTLVLLHEID